MTAQIAVIGDIHQAWDREDVAFFNQSSYELLLFVGDLPARTSHKARALAASIGELTRPALLIPGNHDSTHFAQIVGEALHLPLLNRPLLGWQAREHQALEQALSGVKMCGYSLHPFELGGLRVDLLAARPHSMGGAQISFTDFLKQRYGIDSMEASAARLCELIDASSCERMVFLGHNGPTGVGDARDDIWGIDFLPGGGDFGDPDLRVALDYAIQQGKKVLAVIAGHMHHHLRGGGQRKWLVRDAQTLYINAARVPRIEKRAGKPHHHHVAIELSEDDCQAFEVWVADGVIQSRVAHTPKQC